MTQIAILYTILQLFAYADRGVTWYRIVTSVQTCEPGLLARSVIDDDEHYLPVRA